MEPFIGQIQTLGFNYPPRGWGDCNGARLLINQNNALYALLRTTFGGDGRVDFALPDLRGRVTVHYGTGPGLDPVTWGQKSGTNNVQLATANLPAHNHQMPAHNHQLRATTAEATDTAPGSANLLGRPIATKIYATPGKMVSLDDTAPQRAISDDGAGPVSNTGSGTAFKVVPPFLGLEVCIALVGIYPSRN